MAMLSLLVVVPSLAFQASAGAGEAVVLNVPPAFTAIEFELTDDLTYLELAVLDTNGAWGESGDVVRVDLRVLDAEGELVASMAYQQFEDNASSRVQNRFIDLVGEHILISECSIDHPSTDPLENPGHELATSEMEVVFAFDPVLDGASVEVLVYDRAGEVSSARFPYPKGEPLPGPEPSRYPMVAALLVSFVAALALTAYTHREKKWGWR